MRFWRMLCLLVALTSWPVFGQDAEAEWTVMVWMNGDNNLEKFIVQDLEELASVGSTEEVNVVVQLDQRTTPGTYRFRVPPNTGLPLFNAADKLDERNMVDGHELADFVRWAREHHKAKRYALIFSSHGDGWREFILNAQAAAAKPPASAIAAAALARIAATADEVMEEIESESIFLPPGVFGSPNRAISADDSNRFKDALYNREIADYLACALGKGERLDLVFFDACLMGMIEVAYGLRNVASYFVASEELVSSSGMDYGQILTALQSQPSQDGRTFAQRLVTLYRELNAAGARNDPRRTLAAFRLDFMGDLADGVSELSKRLINATLAERRLIQRARDRCPVYAGGFCGSDEDCFFHVDLKRFVDLIGQTTRDPRIRAQAAEVVRLFLRARVDWYAGAERGCDYGSEGLAIYFPRTRDEFENDQLQERAYRKANSDFPVEFVQKNEWPQFLHVYFLNAREEVRP